MGMRTQIPMQIATRLSRAGMALAMTRSTMTKQSSALKDRRIPQQMRASCSDLEYDAHR